MAVGLNPEPELAPIAGIRLGAAAYRSLDPPRDDLAIVEIAPGACCAAVFTRNAFCAAPVTLARWHLAKVRPRYLIYNAGNANAGTGASGMDDALACCARVAAAVGCGVEAVLPFSTGVIGEPLAVDAISAAVPAALARLDENGWLAAARAIMTTDTVPKGVTRRFEIDGESRRITGIVKGSGMIRPDMATMLALLATDASVSPDLLQHCLQRAVERSFNRITVDGDTSTNDACVLVATGASGAPVVENLESDAYRDLEAAVEDVCTALAVAMVRDGEGATKLITIDVLEGRSEAECRGVADAIAHSPLVKTAMFASDPNWGRILAAVGRAGVEGLEVERVSIDLGDVRIVEAGGRAPAYTEEDGQRVMDADEVNVTVRLGRGAHTARMWTCDFSYDYVRINAEYRT